MNKDRIQYLYNQYLNGHCTTGELDELKALLSDPAMENFLNEMLDESWKDLNGQDLADMVPARAEALFSGIVSQPKKRSIVRRLWTPLRAAAILLIITGLTLIVFIHNSRKDSEQITSAIKKQGTDLAPGSNKAVLTLANGQKISLNSLKGGIRTTGEKLVYTDGSSILKDGSRAEKTPSAAQEAPEARLLVLSTPRGGQYQIVLSDGTKVWLNSDSKLTYPAAFGGPVRTVELEGEGYFEVAKDKKHPFMVRSEGQELEVLGTHFNVKAYRDESSVKTTLLEGSVKISRYNPANNNAGQYVVLKPGQQSEIMQGRPDIQLSYANTDEATDWKDGLFLFNDEPVKSIMKRVSRWYNVDVTYQGDLDNVRFIGSYSRNKSLNNLLHNIELAGKVSFKTETTGHGKERRIIVTANY